jgi:hypothetical protein
MPRTKQKITKKEELELKEEELESEEEEEELESEEEEEELESEEEELESEEEELESEEEELESEEEELESYSARKLQHSIALNTSKYSTNDILSVCETTKSSLDVSNRESCLSSFEEVQNLIPPEELQLYVEKLLEKKLDLIDVDPKAIYGGIQSYFGKDDIPTYYSFIPIYQNAITKIALTYEPGLLEIESGSDKSIKQYCKLQVVGSNPYNRNTCLNAIFSNKTTLGRDIEATLCTLMKRYGKKNVFEIRNEVTQKLITRYSNEFVNQYKAYLDPMITKAIKTCKKSKEDKKHEELVEEELVEEELDELPAMQKQKREKVVQFKEDKPKGKKKTKEKKPRKRKTLEINAKEKELFANINKSISDNIVSITPNGVEFIFPESLSEIVESTSSMLFIRTPNETDKFYNLRKHIVKELNKMDNVDFEATTIILMSYLFANKILYGVKYLTHVETALNYVKNRL